MKQRPKGKYIRALYINNIKEAEKFSGSNLIHKVLFITKLAEATPHFISHFNLNK